MKIKKSWITILVIIAVVILAVFLIRKNSNIVSKETAVCIGNNSVIYTQLGCHACEIQEKMFGDNYQYLNQIDCIFEGEKCIQEQITATPTWIINSKKYVGIQSIETLKNLTGCK